MPYNPINNAVLSGLKGLGLHLPDPNQSQPLQPGETMPPPATPFSPAQKFGQSVIDAGAQMPMGALGLGDSTSKANQFGSMASAAFPMMKMGGAIRGLTGAAGEAVESIPNAIQGLKGGLNLATKGTKAAPAMETLGEVNPEFTALGGEGMYNAGRPAARAVADPTEAALQRLMGGVQTPAAAPGSHPALEALSGLRPEGIDNPMLNPGVQGRIEQQYQLNNPGFKAQQKAGMFSGDRTTGPAPRFDPWSK